MDKLEEEFELDEAGFYMLTKAQKWERNQTAEVLGDVGRLIMYRSENFIRIEWKHQKLDEHTAKLLRVVVLVDCDNLESTEALKGNYLVYGDE